MTVKRDLKRRVRERQMRTGESYMTARRHVQAQRPEPVQVIELVDLTEVGAALGMKCHIAMAPELSDKVDAAKLLGRLRDVLLATEGDPLLSTLRAVVLRGEQASRNTPFSRAILEEAGRFRARARAGIGGLSASGRMLAMQVDGTGGPTMVLFALWLSPVVLNFVRRPSLIICTADGFEDEDSLRPRYLAWRDEP